MNEDSFMIVVATGFAIVNYILLLCLFPELRKIRKEIQSLKEGYGDDQSNPKVYPGAR